MQNAKNQPLGGGGLLKHRSRSKMRDYCQRYNHCEITELSRAKKMPYVRLLSDVYGFSPKEIAAFLDCSLTTAYRMISDARWWNKRSKCFAEEEKKIADYILYNAQWRGGVTIS